MIVTTDFELFTWNIIRRMTIATAAAPVSMTPYVMEQSTKNHSRPSQYFFDADKRSLIKR